MFSIYYHKIQISTEGIVFVRSFDLPQTSWMLNIMTKMKIKCSIQLRCFRQIKVNDQWKSSIFIIAENLIGATEMIHSILVCVLYYSISNLQTFCESRKDVVLYYFLLFFNCCFFCYLLFPLFVSLLHHCHVHYYYIYDIIYIRARIDASRCDSSKMIFLLYHWIRI